LLTAIDTPNQFLSSIGHPPAIMGSLPPTNTPPAHALNRNGTVSAPAGDYLVRSNSTPQGAFVCTDSIPGLAGHMIWLRGNPHPRTGPVVLGPLCLVGGVGDRQHPTLQEVLHVACVVVAHAVPVFGESHFECHTREPATGSRSRNSFHRTRSKVATITGSSGPNDLRRSRFRVVLTTAA
jgi:hypothetical protein